MSSSRSLLHHYLRFHLGQVMSLVFFAGYLLSLMGVVYLRSGDRTQQSRDEVSQQMRREATLDTLARSDSSLVQISDFHRMELKNGKPAWEVKGRFATYFPKEGYTQISKAQVIVFRPDGSRITLETPIAKVYVVGSELKTADMEGGVTVKFGDKFVVDTLRAVYDLAANRIEAFEATSVSGNGFAIDGWGMRVDLTTEEVVFLKDVTSRFERGVGSENGVTELLNFGSDKAGL